MKKFKLLFIFILFFSIILINAVCAEDEGNNLNLTDEKFDTIQDLVDNANPGDSIYLENRTYVGENNSIRINKDINIYGSESHTVLDANNASRIFEISKNIKVTISGLTITNGFSDAAGGAILNQGTLSIFNSTIINCHSERGGIYCSDKSNLNIYNTNFEGNTADSGAAIENDNSNGVVNIINSSFTFNSCEEGGAIYNIWGQMNVYNSMFMYNSAERGGAIYNNRGTLKVYSSRVLSNRGTDLGAGIKSWGICEVYDSIIINNTNPIRQGGGFYVSEYSLLLKNCLVSNNSAVYGGGVYVEAKAKLTLQDTSIINNSANRGGGIDVNDGSITLLDSIISNNLANTTGGGVYCGCLSLRNIDTGRVYNCIISNNSAVYGGGVYVNEVPVIMSSCELNNNSANEGGAIYNSGNLVVKNNVLSSNKANDGAAIYNNKGELNIEDVTANNNIAQRYGGVICNHASLLINLLKSDSNEAYFGGAIYNYATISIRNSEFSSNKASEAGAIYSSSDLIINNTKFMINQITRKGGALSLAMGNITIENSIFSSNSGADEGGAIFNYDSNVYVSNSQFISNKAKSYGGAIDNSGKITLLNSLFDKNQANGSGAIDNGGNLTILYSNFTNNKAELNGGAIDNNNILNIIGTIFENNVAGAEGGAIIARKDINISHSSLFGNRASVGSAIYVNNNGSNLSDNWWGTNDPDFENLIEGNLSDDFTWIIMSFKSVGTLMQYENAKVILSFNEVKNRHNQISIISSPDKLPNFKVSLSTGNVFVVESGYLLESLYVPKISSITSRTNAQSITLSVSLNPSRLINNKNIVVDYSGKVTFKVRVVGSNGKVVGQNEIVAMKISGKTYSVKTDKNGFASKTFNLLPGKYSISTTYKGFSSKNTITVKKVLKAKSATRKKSKIIKYSASLKTSKGKPISGKQVTFKIKGKTYKAKTNRKGIATVGFKNLKVGKYKIAVKYLKSTVKTILKVKK